MTQKLTDQIARSAACETRGQSILWDGEVKGFGLRVTPKGAKAFVLDYRANGRQRRLTIGRYPDWSVAAARTEARDLKRRVDRGEDPMGARHELRAAATLADLWDRYRTDHLSLKAPRSRADQAAMWEKLILPALGRHRLAEITPQDVSELHRRISVTRNSPVRANRVVEVLRKAFYLAIDWGWCTENPAAKVARNAEVPRHRYLTPDEMHRLFAALDAHGEPVSAAAIKFLALTGARKGEVLGARWSMFDLDAGIWTKPAATTKQRRHHRVPLSAAALRILTERRAATTGSAVFPGTDPDTPLTDIKRSWARVCLAAGLTAHIEQRDRLGRPKLDRDGRPLMIDRPTARLHDLRHSFASLLASGGQSLPVIGALLGHTQSQTTQRYAHLYDTAMRDAADVVGNQFGRRNE